VGVSELPFISQDGSFQLSSGPVNPKQKKILDYVSTHLKDMASEPQAIYAWPEGLKANLVSLVKMMIQSNLGPKYTPTELCAFLGIASAREDQTFFETRLYALISPDTVTDILVASHQIQAKQLRQHCLSYIIDHIDEVQAAEATKKQDKSRIKLRNIGLLSTSVSSAVRNTITVGTVTGTGRKCALCNKSYKKKNSCIICKRSVCPASTCWTAETYTIPSILIPQVAEPTNTCTKCEKLVASLQFGQSKFLINPHTSKHGDYKIPNSSIEPLIHISPKVQDKIEYLEQKYKNFCCDILLLKITGKNLEPKDINGKSDPFIVVTSEAEPKIKLWKSKVLKKNLNPDWVLEDYLVLIKFTDTLIFTIYDHDLIGSDFMGSVKVKPSQLYFLQQESKKQNISICFEQLNNTDAKGAHSVKGSLSITVSISNLRNEPDAT